MTVIFTAVPQSAVWLKCWLKCHSQQYSSMTIADCSGTVRSMTKADWSATVSRMTVMMTALPQSAGWLMLTEVPVSSIAIWLQHNSQQYVRNWRPNDAPTSRNQSNEKHYDMQLITRWNRLLEGSQRKVCNNWYHRYKRTDKKNQSAVMWNESISLRSTIPP